MTVAVARIDQLADAAKLVIETAAADPVNVYVVCDDLPDLDPQKTDDGSGHFLGFPYREDGPDPPQRRWVCVMAPQYADGGPATRAEGITFYTLDILIAERYEEAGPMPLAWRRERTAWVKEKVVDTLTDERTPLDGSAVADTFEVQQAWDVAAESKVFWCLVSITFMEHAE